MKSRRRRRSFAAGFKFRFSGCVVIPVERKHDKQILIMAWLWYNPGLAKFYM